MRKENKKEVPLMGIDEFRDYVKHNLNSSLHLTTFEAVRRFKSVRRAIRRGLVSPYGEIYPKRPFNNKANTCKRKGHHSRALNECKKIIYNQLKHGR